jgi:hypothetical protein
MRRIMLTVVCYLAVVSGDVWGQGSQTNAVKPIHVPAGTVLKFYLQTRLNPEDGSAIDLLPKGTVLSVKVLDSIDSDLTQDGAEFRGVVISPLVAHDEVIIRADAEVRGLFALLRSRNHPEGFRYELLITAIADGGRLFQLTASLNSSFVDSAPQDSVKASGGSSSTTTGGKNTPPNTTHK